MSATRASSAHRPTRRARTQTLRELREAAGLSATQLGANVGTSESAVRRWEAGMVSPSVENIVKLGIALSVTPEKVLRAVIHLRGLRP